MISFTVLLIVPYLAHDVWVVVGDEAEAPGPARLLVVHHNSVFHLAVPDQKNREEKGSRREQKETDITNR